MATTNTIIYPWKWPRNEYKILSTRWPEHGNHLIILNRGRHDISPTVTILGCTLWSRILDEYIPTANSILTDCHPERGTKNWDASKHLVSHFQDLNWLNTQVSKIEEGEPERRVLILTHHRPTFDARANNPRYERSERSSCSVTDLSGEACWISPVDTCWAFGHTHYSDCYRDEGTKKLAIENQGGHNPLVGFNP